MQSSGFIAEILCFLIVACDSLLQPAQYVLLVNKLLG
jgi:hypothetical protein